MNQSTQRIDLHPTYILHSKPYRDTSLLIEAFSQEHGRLGLVARGVRGGRAKKKSPLQPFRRYLMSWQGRGDLATLTQWEPDGLPVMLGGNTLMSGFYLNELLMRLTHRHDPHPGLFRHYQQVLDCLAQGDGPEACLRYFELNLLDELGYGLILDHDAETGEVIDGEATYCYFLERGPIRNEGQCSGIRLQGQTLLELSVRALDSGQGHQEAKRLMRAALHQYLGERPLKTREIFRQSLQANKER